MTNTTPQSAGETPAAPPDPWAQFLEMVNAYMWAEELDLNHARAHIDALFASALATERQHHAAQLAEKDRDVRLLRDKLTVLRKFYDCEPWESLTAARAEIARLTEERDDHSQCHDTACNGSRQKPRGARGVSCSCRGRDLAYQRAEAAEASLLALQQQMQDLVGRWSLSGDPSDWKRADEVAAHLTGGPA